MSNRVADSELGRPPSPGSSEPGPGGSSGRPESEGGGRPGVDPKKEADRQARIAKGEALLNDTRIGDTEDSLGQAIWGDRPATDRARQRAADLVGGGTTFKKKALAEGIQDRAIQWAFEQGGRNNPGRFSNAYEYYKLKFDEYRGSLDPSLYRNQNLDALAARMFENRIADEMLAIDVQTVLRSGRGAVNLGANLSDEAMVSALRNAEGLGFDDPVSSAYHTLKHRDEYPDIEKVGPTEIESYQNSAARTVREGRLVQVGVDDATGATKLVFHRVIDDGAGGTKITEAIVWVDTEGRASIASYGAPKAVRLGPDKQLPPEWEFGGARSDAPQILPEDADPAPTGIPRPLLTVPPLLSLRPGESTPNSGDGTTAPWAGDLLQHLRETIEMAQRTVPRTFAAMPVARAETSQDRPLTFNIRVPRPTTDMRAESARVLTYSAHLG
ncbi:hypothetical protein [Nocardia sp. bgisy134]|uniref:hypothetical protein n=1 Tax=unclassified Nocardia TaxID=2637762 RepID=UPI003D705D55